MPLERSKSFESMEGALSAFVGVRRRLYGIAYRMLGSAADAEDVVQAVWLRWQTVDRRKVEDAVGFLVTVATRLAINVAKSAQSRREEYVGPWLPEPVDTSGDPGLGAERGEGLEFAVMMLMEKLSPRERAAWVLREAFGYSFGEIGEILQLEEANVRQLVSRGRKQMDGEGGRKKGKVDLEEHRRLLEAFIGAAQAGDMKTMEGLFAAEVVSYSDGGGVVRAARKPVCGREIVAKFVCKVTTRFWVGVELKRVEVNGVPAVAVMRDGVVVSMVMVGVGGGGRRKKIERVYWVMRPSKLGAVGV